MDKEAEAEGGKQMHTSKNERDQCGRCVEHQEVGMEVWGEGFSWSGERNLASLMETGNGDSTHA